MRQCSWYQNSIALALSAGATNTVPIANPQTGTSSLEARHDYALVTPTFATVVGWLRCIGFWFPCPIRILGTRTKKSCFNLTIRAQMRPLFLLPMFQRVRQPVVSPNMKRCGTWYSGACQRYSIRSSCCIGSIMQSRMTGVSWYRRVSRMRWWRC